MTLGAVSGSGSSPAVSFCSCCGAKMVPYFSDDAVVSNNQINQLISESFLTVKGAALFLPRGNSPMPNFAPHISQRWNKHTGDLQKHLQTMFTVLRPEDTIRLAVRLESSYPQVTRYMVVVSTNGRQDTEESIVLGMDFYSSDSCCTVGLVLPLWSDTLIHLDGDGGFSVSTVNRVHVFKPVSVQAMWSALQSLHKACDVARCHNYYPGSLFLTWVSYYQSRISSNQFCINEWNAMQDVESHRANSPVLFTDLPTERERTERLIKMRLREIMMQKDLENVTCKEIRTELEMQMVCNLREFKEFIDNEMIVILGQMDSPTEIFEHVYLGSEWNASNLEELQNSGVRYILNVTREIDNFFPGMFEYHNIRVYDEEATNLLEYWNETYKFITKAKKAGAKCLVHCKMGVSRSASTVIAYAMKEHGWTLDAAFEYVKERRAVAKPNPSFMKQLEEYQGILLASKQRHNKLWRSHSDSDLSDRPEQLCKTSSHPLGRSDSQSNNNNSSPALHHFLGVAVLQALVSQPDDAMKSTPDRHAQRDDARDSPVEESVRTDCDGTVPPPSPHPNAAKLAPEETLANAANAVVTAPAIFPDPPPSLHILPPTPHLQRAHENHVTPLASPGNQPLELFLHFPEQSSSEDLSPITVMSSDTSQQSPSDSQSDRHSPPSPVSDTPLPTPLASTGPSDDNNNPSEPQADGRGEADGSSDHSSDSIDFFSAREKFLGLAQEDRAQKLPEQNMDGDDNRGAEEEEESEQRTSQSEDSDDKLSPDSLHQPHHDNGISVRHIVTEIEAICHPTTSLTSPDPSSPSPVPPPSRSLPLVRSDPGEEPEPEVALPSSTPPSHLQSPSTLPCDLPAGAVRRATEQLEQKLRREILEMAATQRSPLPSPCSEHPPVRTSEQPNHSTQGETTGEDGGTLTGLNSSGTVNLQNTSIGQIGALPHPLSHMMFDSHTVDSSRHTSAQTQRDSGLQMSLDGVTIQESDLDENSESSGRRGSCSPDCAAQKRLARGSLELEKIQQTLRELQAFLHDTGQPQGPRDIMEVEPPTALDAAQRLRQDGKSFLEPAGWHRAIELEARIRQAGLTPPSLMKRSASLAKLDCLELSANDLSDLDLRQHARTTAYTHYAFPTSPSHSDDTWKKQKVLTPSDCPERLSREDLPPSLSPERNEREKPEGGGCGSLGAASRQQGRAHSSRRSRKAGERKQRAAAATLLYNTM
ncbi:protein phosphatase Slingshot homolog 2 isoform X1 [Phyllopteryx taeniolatus]|uniref:protein phosphatase Slingshot homolog 2 isoform X1 n=1 Tax=Phyllopteryx taeniolatus TaxID=161469 RepID=UPI002AD50467|nr:protein phosphatase Slingshot homolog 2 isoform X1 [Phyllopteryx taeniolatus]XP_061637381.1 protein phosphatase Slingshot homolog 2 isoform X1 [Phyllopteryx taeniolatus]